MAVPLPTSKAALGAMLAVPVERGQAGAMTVG